MEISSSIREMDSSLSVVLIYEQPGLYCRNCFFTCNINEDETCQIDTVNFMPTVPNH